MTASVVTITWNSLNFSRKTLPKILELNKLAELIIVDNGSTDGTVEYIMQQIKDNPDKQIKLIQNKENKGISIAKNQGAKEATGKYLLLLDDDMLIENKDFLKNLIEYYEKLDNPAFLMPLFLDKEEIQDGYTRSFGTYYYPFGIKKKVKKRNIQNIMEYDKPVEIAINQGGAMFTKKSIWDELGGFDESQKFNLDDDDISTRALVYGYKNYLFNREYITHLGLTKRKDKERYAWNDRTYYSGKSKSIWKNFQISTVIWMWPLYTLRATAEAIYHSLKMKYPKILFSNIYSALMFYKDLPDTLDKRKIVQRNRKRNDKYILKLNAPEYES